MADRAEAIGMEARAERPLPNAMPTAVYILSAHTPLERVRAEAVVLQWLEESGLDVEYGESDRWIAWVDEALPALPEATALTVEVQFYPLAGAGSQVRWQFRSIEPGGPLVKALAQGLHGRLRDDAEWVVDLWSDGGAEGEAEGEAAVT
jgi:hypothetical protein